MGGLAISDLPANRHLCGKWSCVCAGVADTTAPLRGTVFDMSSVLPTALALNPARDIVFGPKAGKYASTSLEAGGEVKFTMGSVAKPLRAPFGISEPFAGDANTSRRTMDVELKDPRLEEWAHSLDEKVVAAGVQNSKDWFGERLSEAAVRAIHNPLVKPSSKPGYPQTMRVKVNVGDDGDKATKIYKRTGPNTAKGGTKSDVKKRALVVPSVTLSSVMFLNKKFSVSLNCDQLMVVPPDESSSGVAVFGDFVVDDEPPAKKARSSKRKADSDEEFEEPSDSD